MNNALAMLWTLLIVISCVFIYMVGYSLVRYYSPKVLNVSVDIYNQCQPPLETLVDIKNPNNQTRLCPDGNIYIPSIGMITSQTAIPYINACITACPDNYNLINLTCDNDESSEATRLFRQCVTLSAPIGCSSASNPVAHSNTTYYYVNAMGGC